VSLFFRRGSGARRLRRQLDGDIRVLGELAERYEDAAGDGTFDLLGFSIRSFELGSTDDIGFLIDHGIDGTEFFLKELKPNWRELSREERATRIAAFVRFVNLLDASEDEGNGASDGKVGEPLGELRATVRTKIVLLACAYDATYGDDYSRRIARNPRRFGAYELPSALARS
jgi:hypothetical protein